MADLIKIRPRLGWRIHINGQDLRDAMLDPEALAWFTSEELVKIVQAIQTELNMREERENANT